MTAALAETVTLLVAEMREKLSKYPRQVQDLAMGSLETLHHHDQLARVPDNLARVKREPWLDTLWTLDSVMWRQPDREGRLNALAFFIMHMIDDVEDWDWKRALIIDLVGPEVAKRLPKDPPLRIEEAA